MRLMMLISIPKSIVPTVRNRTMKAENILHRHSLPINYENLSAYTFPCFG